MKTIEVSVSLSSWTDDELMEELEIRGIEITLRPEVFEQVWSDMRGRDIPQSLRAILETATGRIWMN